jgi:aminopeptidase N
LKLKKIIFLCIAVLSCYALTAQTDSSWKKIYRGAADKINDLVHTRLDVKFDYQKSWLYGKAWITLKPHGYPTDSLSLDAKGMEIHKIALVKSSAMMELHFNYDGEILRIHLDRSYKPDEKYTVYIDYTAKPDERKSKGSAAITSAKGLYFINPKGENKNEPTEIWTQGETESNSTWFPTIDKPNQKTTEEISMTVPAKYITLSNGKLISKKKNTDGTRTDFWKMDLPHAPYLFFMGVGDYAVIHDRYKGKPVDYYVEQEYAPVARRIFGLTPEMMGFYSRILGVEFPWPKYSQITGREYVSGAMENTTATLHSSVAQQDARELVDGNRWETIVAHELFHQWFGDLVTTESWSNLTLNESFADYSETLWEEYKYGKDAGDEENFKGLQTYLSNPDNPAKNLVRYHYAEREDMFDGVTYAKGGRILHMLRHEVGDSAFFRALRLYLNTNKFKSAEASQLCLAFEEVTGRDLHWFWNQWYYGHGHPKLDISYNYDDTAKIARVIVNQTQDGDPFRLSAAIEIYENGHKIRHQVQIQNKADTFTFGCSTRPDLINVDGDKILLCEKADHKTLDNFIYQYDHAGLYLDRREAIDFCMEHPNEPKSIALLKRALKDRYAGLRIYSLDNLNAFTDSVKKPFATIILDIAEHDPKPLVRAKAFEVLGTFKYSGYTALFEKSTDDSSYSVAGAALTALSEIDLSAALAKTNTLLEKPAKGPLLTALTKVLIKSHDTSHFDMIAENFDEMTDLQEKIFLLPDFGSMLLSLPDNEKYKKGIDLIVKFRDGFPGPQHDEMGAFMNTNILSAIEQVERKAGNIERADYIKAKLP